ncbi:MAG: 3-deoxy-manno-octulosonate cytidylyltransferase [Chromatiales bacterium]|jgi:3-deoxy-manno-octulosonate cytidylyltransferase (CMP-KDO synthetase)
MTKFRVVIPSRYASSRLPGKPLLDIIGKPMIQHVYERALQSDASEVIVATDDQRIATAVESFGGQVCMTSTEHQSGTDRLAEVVNTYGWQDEDIVVNLQGDEPEMPAELINQVADDMESHRDAVITTLSVAIDRQHDVFDPNVVKVVTDEAGYALYFSRAPIPWHRDELADGETRLSDLSPFARHIGLYAYRAGFLREYINWEPSKLELVESLEQLRVLSSGRKIHVSRAQTPPGHGIDTQADLDRLIESLSV